MEKDSICTVELKEQSKLYFGVFWNHYKNHKRFDNRKRIYFITAGVFYILIVLAGYKDFGWGFLQQTDFLIRRLLEIIILFYLLLLLNKRLEIWDVYIRYWKMRKILYKNGMYVETVSFSSDGIQIQRYEEKEKMIDSIKYNQIKQIKFYRNGVIIKPYEDMDYIYVSKNQFRNVKDFRMVRAWCQKVK